MDWTKKVGRKQVGRKQVGRKLGARGISHQLCLDLSLNNFLGAFRLYVFFGMDFHTYASAIKGRK